MYLDPTLFDYREWVALKYVQDWAFLDGKEPVGDYIEDYKKSYSDKERAQILKIMRVMQFSNYFFNTIVKKPWIKDFKGTSTGMCNIKGGSSGEKKISD